MNEITLPDLRICRKCQVNICCCDEWWSQKRKVEVDRRSWSELLSGALIPSRVWKVIILRFDSFLLVFQFIASIEKSWFCSSVGSESKAKFDDGPAIESYSGG